MAISDYTKKLKKLRNAFFIIDLVTYIGLTIVMVIAAISKVSDGSKASTQVFSQEVIRVVTSMTTTAIIGILLTIFIKDKARTTLFIINTIIGSIIWGATGMYTVLLIWFVEEYLFHTLYKHYHNKVIINKEIDKRE